MNEKPLNLTASLQIQAAHEVKEGEKPRHRRFAITAYTGGPMNLTGWRFPVVVDLAGLSIGDRTRPIFISHNQDVDDLLGQTDKIEIVEGNLVATGEVLGDSPRVQRVITLADKGFNWQASIGAKVRQVEFIREGKSVTVNGQEFTGPVNVARQAVLGEISFVTLGADGNTSAVIASGEIYKEFNMDEKEKTEPTKEQTQDVKAAAATESVAKEPPDIVQDIRAQATAESKRIAAIRGICKGVHADVEVQAIEEGWDQTKTELEVLRASRPKVSAVSSQRAECGPKVLEAAALLTGGIEGDQLLPAYGEETLEAADKRFRHGIGLQQLMLEAAWANGYDGRHFRDDPQGVLQAAFSTFSLPGILSNVANKFLLAGFESVETTWRQIAATRSVKDFKTVASYRLTGGFEYEEVGPDGELKHAEVGEESFTNQAKTYGKIFSLTRTDLINDDLDALTAVPRRIGRGGALKLNKVFWTTFLNNAVFFTTGHQNYQEGADTALSIDGLTAAELMFLTLTDPDGNLLALSPAKLLVPPALKVAAELLMSSLKVNETTTANKPKPSDNPHAGKFGVVVSTYLSNATIAGNSAKAWYLLARPEDLAVIEVAFLNGKQQPTVEQAEADFKTLGVQFRGYFDFGVALQDYRAGIKMKGEV